MSEQGQFNEPTAWKAAEEIKGDVDKRSNMQSELSRSESLHRAAEIADDKETSGGYHQDTEPVIVPADVRKPIEIKDDIAEREMIIDGRIAKVEDENA